MACRASPRARATTEPFTLSQAFDAGRLGVERIGLYGYRGPAAHRLRDQRRRADSRHRDRQQVVLPDRCGGRLLPRATRISAAVHAWLRRQGPRGWDPERHVEQRAARDALLHQSPADPHPAQRDHPDVAARRCRRSPRRSATSMRSPSAIAGIRSCSAGPGSPCSASCRSPRRSAPYP